MMLGLGKPGDAGRDCQGDRTLPELRRRRRRKKHCLVLLAHLLGGNSRGGDDYGGCEESTLEHSLAWLQRGTRLYAGLRQAATPRWLVECVSDPGANARRRIDYSKPDHFSNTFPRGACSLKICPL